MVLPVSGAISFGDINNELYAGPAFPLTWQSTYSTATNATSYTSGTLSFGDLVPSAETRFIIVATHGCVNADAGQISSVSIGGFDAIRLYQISSSQSRPTELWYIKDNTLTSGTVTVGTSTTQASFGFSVWRLTNPLSITPSFTSGGTVSNNTTNTRSVSNNTTNTRSITVPVGGAGMCLCSPNFNSGTITWTNANELYERVMQSGQTCSGAITTNTGTYDVTSICQFPQNNTLVLACWEPMYNNSSSVKLEMNGFDFRKLAAVGNTGQSLTPGTAISMNKLYGHARYNRNFGTWEQNPDIATDTSNSGRYIAGQTWISYTVLNGGAIGSTSRLTPSLTIPNFAASGDIVDIILKSGGYIAGAGGNGGNGEGGGGSPAFTPGQSGGTAIRLNSPVLITNEGVIGGGGGGGGGGNSQSGNAGGGGGGGAGFNSVLISGKLGINTIIGGSGGNGPSDADNGTVGSLTSGGSGGAGESGSGSDGQAGGAGGNLGQAGRSGVSGAAGGAGGISISGTRNATFVTAGTILGTQIF